MLIKCPRCGFQQPKDKYCAQCGVDMESFKPATIPLWKRFFGNPLVQLSILLIIAGSAGFYIYQRGQDNLQSRVAYLKSGVQINHSNNLPPAQPDVPSPQELSMNQAPSSTAQSAQEMEAASKDTPATAKAAGSPTATPAAEKSKDAARNIAKIQGPHLVVYYAEVPRPVLGRIFEASRTTGQFMSFADYTAGILPGIDKRLEGIKILHREERPVESSKIMQWFYGLKDRRNPNVEIGMTTFFELGDIDNGVLRGNLEIQRTWREPIPTGGFEIQRKSFPAIFEIGSGTGFFMSGVMPPQSNLENDDELTAIDVYKVLHSPQFRAGDSEFVVFVEFAKGN